MRDGEAAQALNHWKPSQDLSSTSGRNSSSGSSSSMRRPYSHSAGGSSSLVGSDDAGLTRVAGQLIGQTNQVPSWMFGTDDSSLTAAVMTSASFDHSGVRQLPGSNGAGYSSSAEAAAPVGSRSMSAKASRGRAPATVAAAGSVRSGFCQRPASAAPQLTRSTAGGGVRDVLGLAEKRREVESRKSDLAVVRALD